jgi:cytidine deaminase
MKTLTNKIRLFSSDEISSETSWINNELEKLGTSIIKNLIQSVVKARKYAYIPYSEYAVGASVLCKSGKIYSACNTEVVTYSQTGHAESNSINKAITEGESKRNRKFIRALAVCGSGNSGPCGACRQEIIEHCDNAVIFVVDPKGTVVFLTSLKILLPMAFTPSHLGK